MPGTRNRSGKCISPNLPASSKIQCVGFWKIFLDPRREKWGQAFNYWEKTLEVNFWRNHVILFLPGKHSLCLEWFFSSSLPGQCLLHPSCSSSNLTSSPNFLGRAHGQSPLKFTAWLCNRGLLCVFPPLWPVISGPVLPGSALQPWHTI